MEGPKLVTTEGLSNGDRKLALKTEFGALRHDWFRSKGIDIEGKKYSEIKAAVQQFYTENSSVIKEVMEATEEDVDTELEELSVRDLDFRRLAEVRQKLNLPKWVSLSETVAFIKTAMDLSDEGITERYAEYCASGISLDDMRNTLAYENDVKPVRLDTDIYHQSPNRTRSVIEIASNAIDANAERENTIGRFGVGFYQILSHLGSKDDVVTVQTGTKEDGFYELSFRLIDSEIKFNLKAIDEQESSGTTVTLKSKDFPAEEAVKMMAKHLSYNSSADVFCNGKLVNNLSKLNTKELRRPTIEVTINEDGYVVKDNGKGMAPQIILEKLLVPKVSGKRPFDEILKENKLDTGCLSEDRIEGDNELGKVVINVGGVTIEEFETSQFNTVKVLVIDLPPSTFLSEERNKIAVDRTTIASIKKITTELCSSGRIDSLNALYSAVENLQKRSLSHLKEDNMLDYLRLTASESLPEDKIYVPNGLGFERLKIENAVLLNPGIKSTSWTKIKEIQNVQANGDGINLYVAPLEDKLDEPVIVYKNRIIISEDVYKEYRKDPTILNHYLEAFGKAESIKVKEVPAVKEDSTNSQEGSEGHTYSSIEEYLVRNYETFGFLNEGAVIDFVRSHSSENFVRDSNLVLQHIINKYPEAYAKSFVSRIITGYKYYSNGDERLVSNLDEENLRKFSQLASDPELINLLLELDVLPIEVKEKERHPFKNLVEHFSVVQISDPDYKGQKAFILNYYDRTNLVFEDGQRLDSHGGGMYLSCTKEFFLGPNSDFSKLKFVNGVTREIREIDLNIDESSLENIQKLGLRNSVYKNIDGRDILIFNYNRSYSSDKGEQCAYMIDIHTGDFFNPRPDLGEIVSINQQPSSHSTADTREIREAQKLAEQAGAFAVMYGSKEDDGTITITHILLGDKQSTELTSYDLSKYSFEKENESWILQNLLRENYYNKENHYKYELGEDGQYRLLFNGQIAFETNSKLVFEEIKRKGFAKTPYSESDIDTYIKTQNIIVGDEEYSTVQLRGGETLVFDQDGNMIQRFDENTVLCGIQLTKDGNIALITAKRNEQMYERKIGGLFVDSNMIFFDHNPDSRSVTVNSDYFSNIQIMDTSGKDIKIDDLNDPGNILFSNSHGNQLWSREENSLFSFKRGAWDYSFSVESCNVYTCSEYRKEAGFKYGYDKRPKMELAKLIDSSTGEPLLPNSFRSVRYLKDRSLWECIEANDEIENNIPIVSKYYIDTKGKVVDIIKKAQMIGDFSDKQSLNYYDQPTNNKSIIKIEREFSEKQQNSIGRILSEKVFEGRSDVPSLMSRLYKYNYLSDENFDNVVEILASVEYLDDRLLSDEMISDVMTQLKDHDSESKAWFYKIASSLIPSCDIPETKEFFNRMIMLYKSKISYLPSDKKQEIYDSFGTARDYNGEYLVNGWNIVKYKTPVSLSQVPENIRAIVDYLTVADIEVLGGVKDPIAIKSSETFTLSELIQTKRLNETRIINIREPDELKEVVKEKTFGKSQDHIRREIIHPIYYQTVDNNYLFIRELVQNAHDAVIESKNETQDNTVKIDVYSRNEGKVTLRIEDPIGMDFHTVVNYFLIPGETTKLDSDKAIGYFGQGLFTLFRGAEEVVLQTSVGDGKISKLKITPRVNENGMISDLNVHFESDEGQMKGTVIERTVKTDSPVVEAAYIKNATSTFASLVDGDVIKINLNNRQINGSLGRLASVDVEGLGKMTMYDAPNNVVTQRGLFIKTVDKDYDTNMADVEELLKKRGYVLNIPENIDLTRSRNEIARKEEVLETLKGKVANVKMRAYLEIFKQDIQKGNAIQLDNLPYDYFHFPVKSTIQKTESDVQKIINGEPIDDVEEYYDRGSLISLLVRLPAVQIDDKTYSIYDLKWASIERKSPLDDEKKFSQIPKSLREKLLEGRREYDRLENQSKAKEDTKVDDFEFNDWQKQPIFIREQISKQLDQYKGLVNKVGALNEKILSTFPDKKTVGTTFYYEPNSKAHATQGFGVIGWNLSYWNGWNVDKFKKEELGDKDMADFLYVWSHEWGHILEKSREFTHNKSFYKKQAEALSRLMYAEAVRT